MFDDLFVMLKLMGIILFWLVWVLNSGYFVFFWSEFGNFGCGFWVFISDGKEVWFCFDMAFVFVCDVAWADVNIIVSL